MDKIKVLVVDDHPMVLEGMKSMLAQIHFVAVIGTASSAFEAVEIIKHSAPDIVITDINMPEISGIELALKIKNEFPQVKIIAMSTFKERSYIAQMVLNGASGYLVKSASKEEIEDAILSVYEGKLYMSLDVNLSASDIQHLHSVPVLSSREKEVLQLIADGFTNPQIGQKLYLSLHTIDSHRKNILTKFGVNNTANLIKLAAKHNMV
ncbi:MAG: response regulator transcription factor [Ferruginibacter sp.]|nr:response regulator transcription factor [Ferruginibacter sp.]